QTHYPALDAKVSRVRDHVNAGAPRQAPVVRASSDAKSRGLRAPLVRREIRRNDFSLNLDGIERLSAILRVETDPPIIEWGRRIRSRAFARLLNCAVFVSDGCIRSVSAIR